MGTDDLSLDELMDLDPLSLSTDPNTEGGRNLDAIIARHRQARAREADDPKGAAKAKPTINIQDLLAKMVKKPEAPAPMVGGVRRPR